MRARDTTGWFKVYTNAGNSNLANVYFWIVAHCKGKFSVEADLIKFEKAKDATYFGIGYK